MRPLLFLLVTLLSAPTGAQVQTRDAMPVPALPGYTTLKGDLHLHTVFSDGTVWPTVHVLEAWRDGLDVISLSEHVEYQPHAQDVKTPISRSYDIAKPMADELGMILIPGVEITKPASPDAPQGATAHFNALFVTDVDALNTPDLLEALRRARAQGAFVFWNHPGFRVPRAEWFPAVASAYGHQLFQGIELVNGPNFYPEAYPWIEEKRLTILSNSDAHDPVPSRERGGVRPMTLIFARTADAAGVREALFAARTAAWMGGELWGAEGRENVAAARAGRGGGAPWRDVIRRVAGGHEPSYRTRTKPGGSAASDD
jgi:3',5'-nucleoside bisphosphate phosphatase